MAPELFATHVRAVQENAGAGFAWGVPGEDGSLRAGGRAFTGQARARFAVGRGGLEVRASGETWRLGFGAASLGRSGLPERALAEAAPRAQGNVVELNHEAVVERFVHGPLGVEHTLAIDARPEGRGALRVALRTDGLAPELVGTRHVALRDGSGRTRARVQGLWVVDADERSVPARFVVTEEALTIEVDDEAARYPLLIDPLIAVEEATLSAIGAAADDQAGFAVAMDGDGDRAVVGVPFDDPNGGNSGSARVYTRSGAGVWSEEATLDAFDGEADDRFGDAVAISEDGNRILVGVPADRLGTGPLAVFFGGSGRIFNRGAGGTWSEDATLERAAPGTGDLAGDAVAISDDGLRAILGSRSDDTAAGADAGSAIVFGRTGPGVWVEEDVLEGSAAAGDQLGFAVAIDDDGTRAVVGAPEDDTPSGAGAGSARIFVRSTTGTTWTEEDVIEPTLPAGSRFGAAVGMDDAGELMVGGSPSEDFGGETEVGGGRVFSRGAGGVWSQQAVLRPAGARGGDFQGSSVTMSGDGLRAIVGAPNDDVGSPLVLDAGSATIFSRSGVVWTEEVTLSAMGGAADDRLGAAVAIANDGTRAVVGAPDDDTTGGANAGTARVFDFPLGNGEPCSSNGQCESDFCVDGVCCATSCGGGATTDCQACSVASGAATDGTCGALSAVVAPTVTCRASSGVCDVAETCVATSTSCPADAVLPSTTMCRDAAMGAECDVAEFCDGVSGTCPADGFEAATVVCRPAVAGGCDRAELCTGTSAACPPDTKRPSGEVCNAADPADLCDADDVCDGVSDACAPLFVASGTVCRPEVPGGCDIEEVCDGVSTACPSDVVEPPTVVCRPAVDADCDAAETCTGTDPACPADVPAMAGAVCLMPWRAYLLPKDVRRLIR
ncbi:MAG: hypothetical protein AAGH15_21165 [Myxococcota bacterium]